jgi:cytochrome c oxidase assembly protein subunit 15
VAERTRGACRNANNSARARAAPAGRTDWWNRARHNSAARRAQASECRRARRRCFAASCTTAAERACFCGFTESWRVNSFAPVADLSPSSDLSYSSRVGRSATWLDRFAWLTCVATLLLICSGGMVTSKNVGLAVPDWPTTFGYNMFLFPISKWVGGILFEHTHRLMGSLVGFLTIILAVWLWLREDRRWVRSLGVIAVVGVILQGILGGLRVTMMKDQIGIFHACVAQAFLGLLVFIALVTTKFWPSLATRHFDSHRFSPIKALAIAITVAIYAQLALGATMRHQHRDLAILDFPTANGAWIPDTSAAALAKINAWRDARALSDVSAFQIWLQLVHRFLALIIAIAIVAFCARVWREMRDFAALKRLSLLWVVLSFGQIALGAWVIWSNKAADIATAHVALGAVMLSFGVSISSICWRISQRETDRARPPSAPKPMPA